ncbi:MAG: MmgE/PrpD family protein [Pseudomonadota bacterium]
MHLILQIDTLMIFAATIVWGHHSDMTHDPIATTTPPASKPTDAPVEAPATTLDMARWCAGLTPSDVTERAREWARHCLLDWCAVTVAGSREPLAEILREELLVDGLSAPQEATATVVGAQRRRTLVNDAALINGALSHALDFDDVHQRMHGHPTVTLAPAVLALGEARRIPGEAIVRAFVAGYEVAGALGAMMGDAHYDRGFHATATVGSVASAAACSVLLELDATATARAMAIAGSQAAGLKANFGTMTKPLHAGRAAANGLLSARLAARGFTARETGLECEQGFGPTLSDSWTPAPFRPDPEAPFEVEANLFKYHAACYLTHSAIEAVRLLREQEGVGPEDFARLTLHVPASFMRVCDIREPRTGLDLKFSIRTLTGLALRGADTSNLSLYTDETAQDPDLAVMRTATEIAPVEARPGERHAAAVTLETKDGRRLNAQANVGVPAADLASQATRLEAKARAIAAPVLGEARAEAIIAAAQNLDAAPDLDALISAIS